GSTGTGLESIPNCGFVRKRLKWLQFFEWSRGRDVGFVSEGDARVTPSLETPVTIGRGSKMPVANEPGKHANPDVKRHGLPRSAAKLVLGAPGLPLVRSPTQNETCPQGAAAAMPASMLRNGARLTSAKCLRSSRFGGRAAVLVAVCALTATPGLAA